MTSRMTSWEPRRRAADNKQSENCIKSPLKEWERPNLSRGSHLYSYHRSPALLRALKQHGSPRGSRCHRRRVRPCVFSLSPDHERSVSPLTVYRGGPAGSVVAGRLAYADPNLKVMLIEGM